MIQVLSQEHAGSVREQVKFHEGLCLEAYRDGVGVPTIGWGRNMRTRPPHLDLGRYISPDAGKITLEEAETLFAHDIREAFERAQRIIRPGLYARLSDNRKAVIIDMAFNLGDRLGEFRKFIARLQLGNYEAAAFQMSDSKWAVQVGKRADRLALMMGRDIPFKEAFHIVKDRAKKHE